MLNDASHLAIKGRTSIALGNFDGVHKGHQQLINKSIECAKKKDLTSIVLSFFPHPSHIIEALTPVPLIYMGNEKEEVIADSGVDFYIEIPFTKESAKMEPEMFVKEILLDQLKAEVIIVGSNYRFGHKRKGDVRLLKKLSKTFDFDVIVVDNIMYNDQMMSSTIIRQLIHQGEMVEANELLGRPYSVKGTVMKGRQLGRTLGFPTINFKEQLHKQYPPKGVYVTTTNVHGEEYPSVTSVGVNPTVAEGNALTVETYIFDYAGDLYNQELKVSFYKRIRSEMTFPSLEHLVTQMKKDVEASKSYFQNHDIKTLY